MNKTDKKIAQNLARHAALMRQHLERGLSRGAASEAALRDMEGSTIAGQDVDADRFEGCPAAARAAIATGAAQ